MKRSELKRKSPLRARSVMKRTPMKARPRKRKADSPVRFRSRKYLDWVKSQPCVMCRQPADDPHHIIGVGGFSGTGLTAPDNLSIPVCRRHHDEIHQRPELWPSQWGWIRETALAGMKEFSSGSIHAALVEALDTVTERMAR